MSQVQKKESTGAAWLIFLVSLVITLGLLFTIPAYFWIPLPFVFTYFTKAMNWL